MHPKEITLEKLKNIRITVSNAFDQLRDHNVETISAHVVISDIAEVISVPFDTILDKLNWQKPSDFNGRELAYQPQWFQASLRSKVLKLSLFSAILQYLNDLIKNQMKQVANIKRKK